jgi:hypothetical protein
MRVFMTPPGPDRWIRDESVRFAVHGRRGGCGRGLDEAEDLALALVDPVPQVLHVVGVLRLQVSQVRLRDVLDLHPTVEMVHVHVERHLAPLSLD